MQGLGVVVQGFRVEITPVSANAPAATRISCSNPGVVVVAAGVGAGGVAAVVFAE